MREISVQDFKSEIFDFEQNSEWSFQGSRPVIIDFYADWCGPCKMMAPVLEELEKEHGDKIDFVKVNIDTTPELPALFGVMSVPTLIFVPKEGQPAVATGFAPKENIERAIGEIFA